LGCFKRNSRKLENVIRYAQHVILTEQLVFSISVEKGKLVTNFLHTALRQQQQTKSYSLRRRIYNAKWRICPVLPYRVTANTSHLGRNADYCATIKITAFSLGVAFPPPFLPGFVPSLLCFPFLFSQLCRLRRKLSEKATQNKGRAQSQQVFCVWVETKPPRFKRTSSPSLRNTVNLQVFLFKINAVAQPARKFGRGQIVWLLVSNSILFGTPPPTA